jgi:hypothetical protein
MKKNLKLVIVAFVCVASVSSACAYIDPGTGGMIFRSIWPAIGAFLLAIAAFFTRKFIKPIKKLFKRIFRKSNETKKDKKYKK